MQINDLHSLSVVSCWAIFIRNEGLMRSVSYKYGNGMWIYIGGQLYRRRQIGLSREYKICYHRRWHVLSSHANMYGVCMCVLGDIKRMWRQIDSLEVTHIQRDYLYRSVFFSFHSFPLSELFQPKNHTHTQTCSRIYSHKQMYKWVVLCVIESNLMFVCFF